MKKAVPVVLMAIGVLLMCGGAGLLDGLEWVRLPVSDNAVRVLVTYNNDTLASLPPSQKALIESSSFRTELDKICSTADDGSRDWRIIPVQSRVESNLPQWKQLFEMDRKQDEWIVIQSRNRGYSGPLPVTEQKAVELVKDYTQ